MKPKQMLEPRSWEEFRATGLLWFVNRILHLFGWAITFIIENDQVTVKDVFPARCKFRGFEGEQETAGFKQVTEYLKDNIEQIDADAEWDTPGPPPSRRE